MTPVATLDGPASSRCEGSGIAEDLGGWSALPLLAPGSERQGSWLFILSGGQRWLMAGPPASGNFRRLSALDLPWPFADGELAGVVIDGDGCTGRLSHTSSQLIAEADRVTGVHGRILVVCRHRLLPTRLRAWRQYGPPTVNRWRRSGVVVGLKGTTAGFAELDSDRVVDLISKQQMSQAQPAADREVLHMSRTAGGAPVVEDIVDQVSSACGMMFRIDRTTVRKIGKTAVFVSDGRHRYIVRIARSPIAESRALRNFEALEGLHRSSLSDPLKRCLPIPVTRGTLAGYPYFVETCLDGETRNTMSPGQWPAGAAEFITSLHAATQQRTRLDDQTINRLVTEPMGRISRAVQTKNGVDTISQLLDRCAQTLSGCELALVQAHGDFTEANCLFDRRGQLTGVVDWEVNQRGGLPLLDLLQVMPVGREIGPDGKWERFRSWLTLWREPERVVADPIMGRYLRTLDVPPDAIPALLALQWVTHVAERIEARSGDDRWMRLRVWEPLESFRNELGD